MRTISLILALASVGHADWPPRGAFFTGSASKDGIAFKFATVVEPLNSDRQLGDRNGSGFQAGDSGTQHRVLWDDSNHLYFGYDITAEAAGSAGDCRVTITPLSLRLQQFRLLLPESIDRSRYQLLTLPTYPQAQFVHPEDTIAVDLLVSPDGKQKVVDYIRVTCHKTKSVSPPAVSSARDFSMRDVQLHIVNPEVSVNGQSVANLRGDGVGNILWIAIPGKGRFLLSLAPYRDHGFRLGGSVRGREMWFENGNDRYRIRLAEPLARSDGQWNLYVRAETSYLVKEADFGAANRPDEVSR